MSNSSKAAKQLSAKRIRTRNNVIVYIVLSILAFIWLFPVAWIIMTSFRGEKGSYISTFFPKTFTLDNYIKLFTDTTLLNFPQMFLNTLFIAICSCILSSFFLLSAAYCLSRLRFKLRKPYMNMAMVLGLFPGFMSMVAVYFILKAVGLTEGNSVRFALIAIRAARPWASRSPRASSTPSPWRWMKPPCWTAAPGGRSSPRSPCPCPSPSSSTPS